MSLNHLTSRNDSIWPELNIGCASISSPQYYVKNAAGTDIALLSTDSFQGDTTGLTISLPAGIATVVNPQIAAFMAIGNVLHYDVQCDIQPTAAGSLVPFNLDIILPAQLFATNFTSATQASGQATLSGGGSFRFSVGTPVVGQTTVRFQISSIDPVATVPLFKTHISGSAVTGA